MLTVENCSGHQITRKKLLFPIKSYDPDHRWSNHTITISCWDLQVCISAGVLQQGGSLLLSSGVFVQLFPLLQPLWVHGEHRSTFQYLPAVRLKWWGWWRYLLSGSLQSNGHPLHSHLLNTDKWGKSSVHREAACTKKCSRRSCTNWLHTDSSELLTAPLAGYVWLVLSNFLGHTRSCEKNQKTEMKQWIK